MTGAVARTRHNWARRPNLWDKTVTMTSTTPPRSSPLLAVIGLAMIGAFFMPWVDLAGLISLSGYRLARGPVGMDGDPALWFVPIAGLMLLVTGLAARGPARLTGFLTGVGIVGMALFRNAAGLTRG